jgi:3',5'-cyclic-AMP phosphodiesterase
LDDPNKQAVPFRFVHLTDPHIVDETSILLQVKTADRLKQAVDEINDLNPQPQLVIVTGDILLNEMRGYPLFTKIMSQLKAPYICTFGNHDKPAGLPVAAKVFSEWGYPPYYSFDFHRTHFIILDAVDKINPKYGHISEEQLSWLKQDLDHNRGKLTLIFLHHDLFSGTGVDNYQETRTILAKYPDVQWIFGGHWHADTFVQDEKFRHILTTSIGYQFPVLNMKWSHGIPGFRIVDVDGRNIKTSFKPLGREIMPDPEPNQYLTIDGVKSLLEKY